MAFSLATFNTRDLFDEEPPQVIAELDRPEYTPERRVRALQLLDAKLAATAATLVRLDADILCLQEVKGERVLRLLLERLEGRIAPYRTLVVGEGQDARGINTAVLSRFPLAGEPRRHNRREDPEGFSLPALEPTDPPAPVRHAKRGLLEVTLDLPAGQRLVVFNVHLKSNHPVYFRPPTSQTEIAEASLRATLLRVGEALRIRQLVDQHLARDAGALVAVAGDFNSGPDSVEVKVVSGDHMEGIRRGIPGYLHTVTTGVPAERRYSILFRGAGHCLDHCLVSNALWSRFREARGFNETLYDLEACFRERAAESPDSDHAPLMAWFH